MPPVTPTVSPSAGGLAEAQLQAYNQTDLDAFCACYADDVRVLDADGQVTLSGMERFRVRYEELFSGHEVVGAAVDRRLELEPHVVDDERWWRVKEGVRSEGRVLVRYTIRQGRIAVVQFFRPG